MSNSEPNSSQSQLSSPIAKFPTGTQLSGFAVVMVLALAFVGQLVIESLPLVSTFVAVVIAGYFAVPILQQMKAGQVIREDGPEAHLKKGGTPTMGGIFVVPVGLVMSLLWSGFNFDVIAACGLTLGFGLVGWLDDWQILRYKSNKGISPRTKLGLQALFTLAFCLWVGFTHSELTTVNLPFILVLPLGILFFPLAAFVLLGASNSTNLTDGLDGLAGGTGAIALMGIGCLLAQAPSSNLELAVFCSCMSGSYLGFLWHNRNPARVFMGDTGSLALGGAIASAAILGNMLWGLLIIGAIFVWEAISVILQVSYYKLTKNDQGVGKRLFKMAPYHHHLELSGWKETQVVGIFYITQALLVLVAIALNFVSKAH
ncbi:Phospho-N-acetylmuramoyl-pentapeptide-transferase [Synechococcus sp. PCC 7502]|uniref:phospho-N-acetylmuramoyl-pentapeptide- transferase n=1 Tax=Synechococcus sp. PCC 7502 TaxID=1173263 RepID=UPI00029FDD79|nr:phospho-N-acetylmuramoyl-pentapeptide-transferase [Synechococcus sp. PCC 7502]AFY72976.1 Phospho-N-acetylmuramoyl-pentapeptide-transferase [Synechococcus sp. PCC 7502]